MCHNQNSSLVPQILKRKKNIIEKYWAKGKKRVNAKFGNSGGIAKA